MTAGNAAIRFSIRRATTADAATLGSLGARLFAETYGPSHPEPELSRYLARTFSTQVMRDAIAADDSWILVAEDADGTAVAYSFLRDSPDPPPDVIGERAIEIVRFYVDGVVQGRGIGAALMTRSLDDARERGADVVWLQTWQQAEWAIGFYRRMGFTIVGSAPFYFGEMVAEDYVLAISIG
jgi:ribosomal protein S18 acetylase RimI-like enzyme